MQSRDGALFLALIATVASVLSSGCLEVVDTAAAQEESAAPAAASSDASPPGQTGNLVGQVTKSSGALLAGAHVVLIGTPEFRTTGDDGSFEFLDLTAGTYKLRVDAVNYHSYETEVQVIKHQTTKVVVTLAPANGCEPHMHDYWGGQTTIVLMEADIDLNAGDGTTFPAGLLQTGVVQPTLGGPNREFFLPEGSFVYPGTANMSVVFTWDHSTTNSADKISLAVQAADAKAPKRMPAQSSGTPWFLPLGENAADLAHSTATAWKFHYYFPGGEGPTVAIGHMNVRITISKGTVPVDATCVGHTAA